MPDLYFIDARDKPGLLWAVLREVGDAGRIALEGGGLQETGILDLPQASPHETGAMQRQTIAPLQDFVVLPTTEEVVTQLKELLSSSEVFGEADDLEHVQIENGGQLVFAACDNFHKRATWLQVEDGAEILKDLRARGVVRSFAS